MRRRRRGGALPRRHDALRRRRHALRRTQRARHELLRRRAALALVASRSSHAPLNRQTTSSHTGLRAAPARVADCTRRPTYPCLRRLLLQATQGGSARARGEAPPPSGAVAAGGARLPPLAGKSVNGRAAVVLRLAQRSESDRNEARGRAVASFSFAATRFSGFGFTVLSHSQERHSSHTSRLYGAGARPYREVSRLSGRGIEM